VVLVELAEPRVEVVVVVDQSQPQRVVPVARVAMAAAVKSGFGL
jgi:hypothetical protein